MAAIDADVLENDADFVSGISTTVDDIPNEEEKKTFSCSFCTKVCLSKQGLSHHVDAKHSDQQTSTSKESNLPKNKSAEEKLHPLYFKKYLKQCVAKLAADECYPEEVMHEFKMFNVGSLTDVLYTYNIIRDVIQSFKGDSEKFYPLFYKRISDVENHLPILSVGIAVCF